MGHNVSELAVKASYDAGHQNLPWDLPLLNENLLTVDLDALLASPKPKEAVQALPPQVLYHSIKSRGMEDALAVVRLVSTDQLTRMLDYDVWPRDQLDPKRAFAWLSLFKDQSRVALADRFEQLEEEYQIALLQKFVRTFDTEEYEQMTPAQQDTTTPLPGNEIHYQINSDDTEIQEFITSLITSMLEKSVAYTYSLLAHACYMPPNETELQLQQFRKARLEEDGFVTFDDGLKVFSTIDVAALKEKWHRAYGQKFAAVDKIEFLEIKAQTFANKSFLEQTILSGLTHSSWSDEDALELQTRLLHLANGLSSATAIETDDMSGLNRILQQTKALISLGLEVISEGKLDLAVDVLKKEHPTPLFQAGLSVIYDLQKEVIEAIVLSGFEQGKDLEKFWKMRKWGEILYRLDTDFAAALGLENTEILKGLLNRFPMRSVKFFEAKKPDVERIKFAPIESVAELNEFRTTLKGVIDSLRVVH
jgi:hypothetical protein